MWLYKIKMKGSYIYDEFEDLGEFKYSSLVPEHAYKLQKSRKYNREKIARAIIAYLIENCQGKEKAVNITKLTKDLDIHDKGTTKEATRAIMKYMIINGCLIGGCHKGYFWIKTSNELKETIERIDSYIQGFKNRRFHLLASWSHKIRQIGGLQNEIH